MSSLDAYLRPGAESVRSPKPTAPSGWEPGIAWDGRTGTIASGPGERPTAPDWTPLLEAWGLDPAIYEVVEPVQVRAWDAAVGGGLVRKMWYHRAGLRQKRVASATDVQALIAEVKRHKTRPRRDVVADRAHPGLSPTVSLVIVLSDWQLGKQGTTEAVERILRCLDGAVNRAKVCKPSQIHIIGLGDLIEQCDGHYPMQAYQTELNRREQVTLARRLITKYVTTLAPLVPRMVVAAVGGNHGENRRDGKAYTDFGDNDDVAMFEQVAEVIGANPDAYGHVSFMLPKEQLTLTLDIAGTIVGLAHGHQAKRSGAPSVKMQEWWKGQAFGQRPVGDASLLLTGHYHHLSILEDGARTHMQAPTMDSGSQWFEESSGKPSRPGMLTFTIGPDGWDDVVVLR